MPIVRSNVRLTFLKRYVCVIVFPACLFVACSSPSATSLVSKLVPTDDTKFVASAHPIAPPTKVHCRQEHKKPAGRLYCKRLHWFRWRLENVGETDSYALCHIRAFRGNKPLTRSLLWLPWAGTNQVKAGTVASRADALHLETTRPVSRYTLTCRAAMWTNGAPV
jgi:hypothetical protein